MIYIVHITADDGTPSAAGPFRSLAAAERWAAQLELSTDGELYGQALDLESPSAVMETIRIRRANG